MNKATEYQRGREDGLLMAQRIAHDGGIGALDEEIRFRGITEIHSQFKAKDINRLKNVLAGKVLNTVIILGIACLHDEFGFGGKRCQRFMDKMDEASDLINGDMAYMTDYAESIREQMNINLADRI